MVISDKRKIKHGSKALKVEEALAILSGVVTKDSMENLAFQQNICISFLLLL